MEGSGREQEEQFVIIYIVPQLINSPPPLSRPRQSLLSYLDSNPTDVAGWWELAELYLSQGHWQGAATAFEEVVLFDPLSHEVHTKLGECYYGMAASSKDGVCKDFSGEGMMAMAR